MSTPIRLSDELVKQARRQAKIDRRSAASQIEHWAEIGKIAEENPELSYAMVRDILIAMREVEDGEVEDYKFGEGDET